jgi:hypothetical protein
MKKTLPKRKGFFIIKMKYNNQQSIQTIYSNTLQGCFINNAITGIGFGLQQSNKKYAIPFSTIQTKNKNLSPVCSPVCYHYPGRVYLSTH